MADKVIGVDVGTNAVRAAEVALGAHPKLLRFGQVSLPPGAVVEGEVADGAAVAEALRRLWREVGFKGKSVRVGIASARVILRIVEMPELSDDETRSALKLQLGDYVPMAPEATMFGFQPIAGPDGWAAGAPAATPAGRRPPAAVPRAKGRTRAGGRGGAAAPDAVACCWPPPTRMPCARWWTPCSRAGSRWRRWTSFPPHWPGPWRSGSADTVGPPPVDAIVSLGAGTTLVVVARGGTPLFARTITSVSGRLCTERLADALGLPVARRRTGQAVGGDPLGIARHAGLHPGSRRPRCSPRSISPASMSPRPISPPPAGRRSAGRPPPPPDAAADPALVAEARAAARPLVAELVSEVADSLDYYGSQPGR